MDILQIHKTLNNIYDRVEKLDKKLKELGYKSYLASYNNHFLSIDGNFYNQKYYMPVISIGDKGDICFNLESIEFEFYITKEDMFKINLDELILNYKQVLSIYEYKECTVDLYKVGDNRENILEKVNKSKDKKFGISINCSLLSDEEIIDNFKKVCLLLDKQ